MGSGGCGAWYSRARELAVALDDEPQLLQADVGPGRRDRCSGRAKETQELTRQVFVVARRRRDALFRMAAHAELGGTAFTLGHTTAARKHFELAEALSHPAQHDAAVAAFGMDLGLFTRIWGTHLTWHQGFPTRARAHADKIVRIAAELGHPFTQTITLAYAAMLAQFMQDVGEVGRLAQATIAHATEHGFPYYFAWARVLEGWSRVAQGAGANGRPGDSRRNRRVADDRPVAPPLLPVPARRGMRANRTS